MPSYELILTEAFAASALALNLFAYNQKRLGFYRILSGLSMLLLAIHFFRLEAYAAGVGCSLAFVRNIVSLRYNGIGITIVFVALNLAALAVELFYLRHGPEIFIAYSASLIFTIGTLRLSDVEQVRRWFTLAEGLNLVYGIIVGSIFGSVYSGLNFALLLVKWLLPKLKKINPV